jgi:hypothetical protein
VPSYEAAEHAAGRIPGARLARVEKGGHLMLGPQEAIRAELAASWRHQDRRRPARRRLWGPAASDTVLQHGTAPTPPGMRRLQPVALLGGRQLVRPVGGRWAASCRDQSGQRPVLGLGHRTQPLSAPREY